MALLDAKLFRFVPTFLTLGFPIGEFTLPKAFSFLGIVAVEVGVIEVGVLTEVLRAVLVGVRLEELVEGLIEVLRAVLVGVWLDELAERLGEVLFIRLLEVLGDGLFNPMFEPLFMVLLEELPKLVLEL